jgi:uncharacterized protein (TIGR03083 family)
MSTPAECAKVIQSETERLKQYLAALPQNAWTKPSACALWEIRDVVAHVSGVPTAYMDAITRGLQEDISPYPGSPDQSRIFQTHSQEERQQYRRGLAQRPIANRERLGTDLVSVFSQGWDPFPPFIATLSAEDWHTPCFQSFGIIPVHAGVHACVFELAIHSWDIRSALEPSASLASDALAAMLDFFAVCPHWFFTPAARLSIPIRYRFAFPGALNGPWDILVEGDKAHIGRADAATPAHVTFVCERETFVLLMCGRMGFDAALGDKRLIPTGDMAVVQEFKKWFQGV